MDGVAEMNVVHSPDGRRILRELGNEKKETKNEVQVPDDCFHVPIQFCEDDDEVFFGPVSEKERRRAQKFASRKTVIFDPGFRHDKRTPRRTIDHHDLRLKNIEEGDENSPGHSESVQKDSSLGHKGYASLPSWPNNKDSTGSINITLAKYSFGENSLRTCSSPSGSLNASGCGMDTMGNLEGRKDTGNLQDGFEVIPLDEDMKTGVASGSNARESAISVDSLEMTRDSLELNRMSRLSDIAQLGPSALESNKDELPSSWADQNRTPGGTRRQSQRQVQEYLSYLESTSSCSAFSDDAASPEASDRSKISVEDACQALLSLQIAESMSHDESPTHVGNNDNAEMEHEISAEDEDVSESRSGEEHKMSSSDYSSPESSSSVGEFGHDKSTSFSGSSHHSESATSTSSCSYVSTSAAETGSDDEDEPIARRQLFLTPSLGSNSDASSTLKHNTTGESSYQLQSGHISDYINAPSLEVSSIEMVPEVNDAQELDKVTEGDASVSMADDCGERQQSKNQGDVVIKCAVNEFPDKPQSAKKGLPAYLELLKVEDITVDSEVLEGDLDAIEQAEETELVVACEVVQQLEGAIPSIDNESILESDSHEKTIEAQIVDTSSEDGNETIDSQSSGSLADSSQDEVVYHLYSNSQRTLGTCIEEDEEEETDTDDSKENIEDSKDEEAAVILASLANVSHGDLCRISEQGTLTSIVLDSLDYSMDSLVQQYQDNEINDLKLNEDKNQRTCLENDVILEANSTVMCATPERDMPVNISDLSDSECPTPGTPKEQSLESGSQTPSQLTSLTSMSHTLTGTISLCNGIHSVGLYESPTVRFGSTSSDDAICTNKLRGSQTSKSSVTSLVSDVSSDCMIISPEKTSKSSVTSLVSDVSSDCMIITPEKRTKSSESELKVVDLSSDCEVFEEDMLGVHESLYSTVRCPRASEEISNVSNFRSMSTACGVPMKSEPMDSSENKNSEENSDSDFSVVGHNLKAETSCLKVKLEPVVAGCSGSVEMLKSPAQVAAELAEASEDESFHQPTLEGANNQIKTETEILSVAQTSNFPSCIKLEPDEPDFEVVYSNWTPIDIETGRTDVAFESDDQNTNEKSTSSETSGSVCSEAESSKIVDSAKKHFTVMNCQVDSGPHSWMDLQNNIITSCETGSKWKDLGPMTSKSKTMLELDDQEILDDLSISNDSAVQSLERISADDVFPWSNDAGAVAHSRSSLSESSQDDTGESDEPLKVSSPNTNVEFAETLASLHCSPAFPSLGLLSSATFGSPNGWAFPPPSLTSSDMVNAPHVKTETASGLSGFFSFVDKNDRKDSPQFVKQETDSESSLESDSSHEMMPQFCESSIGETMHPNLDKNEDIKQTQFITSVEDLLSHGAYKKENSLCKDEEKEEHLKLKDCRTPVHVVPMKPVSGDEKHVFTSEADGEFNATMDIDEVVAMEPEGYLSLVSRAELLGATDREFDAVEMAHKITHTSAGSYKDNPVHTTGRNLEDKLHELKCLQDEKMRLREKIESAKSPRSKPSPNVFKVPHTQTPRSALKGSHPVLDLTPKHLTKVTKENTKVNGLPRVRLRLQTPGQNTVVRHSPAVKPVSKIKWTEALVVEPAYHTPSRSGHSNKPILVQKPDHVFPYQDDTPSPVGFSRLTRSRTLGRKSLEARYAKLLVKEEKDRVEQVKASSRGRGRGRGRGAKKAPPVDWSQASPKVDTGLHGKSHNGRGAAIKMDPLESPGKLLTPVKRETGAAITVKREAATPTSVKHQTAAVRAAKGSRK